MKRAVRAFEPYDVQYRANTPAGERWIRAVARPVRRVGEEVIYSAVVVDITELKTALTELESSQRQLQQLTATLPGAVFQVAVSASNGAVLTYVSEGITDIFGVPAAELLGSVEKALSFIPDRDPAMLRDRLRQMAQRREPMELERPIVSANDETRWLRFTARPVSGADGAILYNGVVMDITAAKAAASRLADSEQRLELALENGKLGLVDWHVPSGRVHYNRHFAEITGTSKEDVSVQAAWLSELEVPADRKRVAKAWQAHVEGRTVEFNCEYRIVRPDGQQRWLHALGRIVERGVDDTPLRYVGTLRDVTNRVQAERQLEQQVVFSRLITKLSSEFVNLSAGGVDRAIREALALVGGFSGVDLAYLSESGEQSLVRTEVWDARGADGGTPPRSFSWSDVPWLRQRVLARHLIYLPDLGSLPADAQVDHQALQAAGVQGLVVVPLYMGSESLGALVLQTNSRSRRWSRGNLSLLRIVGEIISQALDRKRSEAALAAAESTVREVTRALPGIVYQLYRDPAGTLDWRFVSGTLMDQMTATDPGGQPAALLEAVDQRDLPSLQAALSASAASSGHLEHDVRLGSGMRWARLSAYPRKLPDGGTLFNGIAIDITDTKAGRGCVAGQ